MRIRRTIGLIVIGLGFLGGCEWLCKIGVKCNQCQYTSKDKETSQQEGYYVVDYRPLTTTIELKHHDETIVFDTAWAESTWFYNTDICLLGHKERGNWFNVVLPFQKSNQNTFLFSLDILYPVEGEIYEYGGGIGEAITDIRIPDLPDTIKVRIQEKNPDGNIGWKQGLEGDTIKFIKIK